jgi:hypothetical protein
MRRAALLLALFLSGCIHSRALERQCHQVHVGMSFADAYRTVTATTPLCKFRRPGISENVPDCMERRADIPHHVDWQISVMGSSAPDACQIVLDELGRVAGVHYWRGDSPE